MEIDHPLPIIYHDDYMVAIHKPAGLLVHKSNVDKYETTNAMHLLRDQLGQWVYPVHRLDRPTSGVLLFALDPNIAKTIGEQFEQHQVEKTYWAIVRGYIDEQGIIDHPLKPIPGFKSQKQRYALKEPQEAITAYQRLGTLEIPYAVDRFPSSRYSLVKLKPKTGRKHQLRRHMKHLSHPIIGDPKYGKSKHNHFFEQHFHCPRLLLAATALSLLHPVSQQRIDIQAPVDGAFKSLTEQFVN